MGSFNPVQIEGGLRMFALEALVRDLAWLLDQLMGALVLVIIVRAILSWVNADPYNGLVRAIGAISEPFLRPFRRLLPPWRLGGVDFSPVFCILTIEFVPRFLVTVPGQFSDL